MDYGDIRTGMILVLKPARRVAYAMTCRTVAVRALKPRSGYKVGYVLGAYHTADGVETGYFKPTDFSGMAQLQDGE